MKLQDYIKTTTKNVLLIEPEFPIPSKSRNHSNFLPIGLLKIAAYLRDKDINIQLIRHTDTINSNDIKFTPDLILITSLFTYWSKQVKDCVQHYKKLYSDTPVIVGGIYASLMPEHCKTYTGCDGVIEGAIPEVDLVSPAYDLVDVDYQILRTSRGCLRNCSFCGNNKLSPFRKVASIKNQICSKRIIFYDDNILMNPHIKSILKELISLRKQRKINYVESQSGFDGRLLQKCPELTKMLKDAGFKYPKIAWDYGLKDASNIKSQIDLLINAGYKPKDISVFMIYNYDLDYDVLEAKRVKCAKYGVQVADSRYRPLNQTFDNYNSHKRSQTSDDYYIHPNWTDEQIRKFRRHVRYHNICIRFNTKFYSKNMEQMKLPKETIRKYKSMDYESVKKYLLDAWDLCAFHE